ncbi:zeta toxin family protein, partial [Arachnia propionica]|uniref:zeta toxin family protein n=1 Tax=Arachnia propionica TaxID=1750 RepID=UPI001C8C0348
AAGYRVEIIDVEVPEAVSREAIRQRWRDGYETTLTDPQGLGGRWVPSEYLREVFNGPDGRSWPEHNAETLARTTPEITRLRRYRGTTVTGERILELDLHRPTPDTTLTPRLTSLKQPSRTTHNHLQR